MGDRKQKFDQSAEMLKLKVQIDELVSEYNSMGEEMGLGSDFYHTELIEKYQTSFIYCCMDSKQNLHYGEMTALSVEEAIKSLSRVYEFVLRII